MTQKFSEVDKEHERKLHRVLKNDTVYASCVEAGCINFCISMKCHIGLVISRGLCFY